MAALPGLLKLLTGASLPLAVAMKAAKPLMANQANTEAALRELGAEDLVRFGLEPAIASKVAKALGKCKSGSSGQGPAKGKRKADASVANEEMSGDGPAAGPSSVARPPPAKKTRAKKVYRDPFELAGEQAEALSGEKPYPPIDFGSDLMISALLAHTVKINRAPVMTAWALVCCLRLGFNEQEALSLAHSFTDLNATSKAISLGIKPRPSESKARETELSRRENEGWQQPHVILMGRKLPVMTIPPPDRNPDDPNEPVPVYRALSGEHSTSVSPSLAARYLHSSLAKSVPYLLRAMTLVAESWSAEDLQGRKGWQLYLALRPEVEGWGKKGVVRIERVLALTKEADVEGRVKVEIKEPVKGEDEYDDVQVRVSESSFGSCPCANAPNPRRIQFWDAFDLDEAELLDVKPNPPPAGS